MKAFIRTFNPYINAKTGLPLPEKRRKDGTEWRRFEKVISSVLVDLGWSVLSEMEPNGDDKSAELKICVHKNKSQCPEFDLFYMQMHLKQLFTLDKMGWGADDSRAITKDRVDTVNVQEALDFVEFLKKHCLSTGESKHPYINTPWWVRTSEVLPKKYILAPLQIPRDYVIVNHSPVNVLEYIKKLCVWAENTKTHVVFKLHPFNRKDYRVQYQLGRNVLSNRYVSLFDAHIYDLIERADGVVVINSGVGFESLLFGKPVATFGACDYKIATYDISELGLDGLKEYFSSWDETGLQTAAKYVTYYCKHHAYLLHDSNIADVKNRLADQFEHAYPRS